MAIAYKQEASVEYGKLTEVAPNVRRIVARNASAFTYHGTGTYVLGRGKVAVIDPGPLDHAHVDALLRGSRTCSSRTRTMITRRLPAC
jgi:hypothetical protein